MPIIRVDGPKIAEIERKRDMVSRLTDVAADVYGMDRQHIVVLIRENLPDNVGVGGELIADRHKQ